MAKLKEKDFIEIEYTGKIKGEDIIFDTTDAETAKKTGMFNPKMIYGPVTVCLGQGHLLKGLDEKLVGKEDNKEYEIDLLPEEGFGKKQASLLKLVPMSAFRKQNIRPVPGLQVDFDNITGIVRTVTGGRVIVDFNHPLSSKSLTYKIKINKVIKKDEEKLSNLLQLTFNIKDSDMIIKIDKSKKAKVTINKPVMLNDVFTEKLKTRVQELIGLKDITLNVEDPVEKVKKDSEEVITTKKTKSTKKKATKKVKKSTKQTTLNP